MSQLAAEILNQPTIPIEAAPAEAIVNGETQAPIAEVIPKPDDRISSKLEILMRREQSAVHRERLAKQKELEIESRQKEIEAKLAKLTEFETVKSNPKKALEMLGLSYDDLTKAFLNDGEITPDVHVKKLEQRLNEQQRSMEAEKERLANESKARAEAEYERRTQSFKQDISSYLKSDAKRYELTLFDGQEDEIYKLIDLNYEKTRDDMIRKLELDGEDTSQAVGKVMTIKEAADKIEEYLEKKELEKKKLDKVKAIWGNIPPETQAKIKAEVKQEMKSQGSKTLTNNLSASQTKPETKPMTDDDRVKRAIAYAKSLRN